VKRAVIEVVNEPPNWRTKRIAIYDMSFVFRQREIGYSIKWFYERDQKNTSKNKLTKPKD